MTFSIVARCPRTRMLGVAIATSSIAVGARCPHARARTGAVATQNVTDPALGPLILDRLGEGLDASAALAAATAGRAHLDYRQLTVVDDAGRTAHFTGARILGRHAVATGPGCVAAGNLLKRESVAEAMISGLAKDEAGHLGERLLQALEAGLAAGGEAGDVHSAALLLVGSDPFPLVDLRVDWSDSAPIGQLRALWSAYQPQMEAYRLRAIDPTTAPTYGVAGDP